MGGRDLGSPAASPVWARLGWGMASVFNTIVGLVFVGGASTDAEASAPVRLGLVSLGLFLLVASVLTAITRVVRPGPAAARRRLVVEAGEVEVGFRRVPEACGVLSVVVVEALLVGCVVLAFDADRVVLGCVLVVPTVLGLLFTGDAIRVFPRRRAIRLTPTTLTLDLPGDSLTLAWSDLGTVSVETNTTYARGIRITNRFLQITPRPDPASLVARTRGLILLVPKRRRYARILVSEHFLDQTDRVRDLLDSLRRQSDEGRRAVLSNPMTTDYLCGDLEISPLP